jgi:hypothetical protein
VTPGQPFLFDNNYYTNQGPIQVEVNRTMPVNMFAFLATDRTFDPFNITVMLQDAIGNTFSTGTLALAGPFGHNGDFADNMYPVQLSPTVIIQANVRYQIAFSQLPTQDRYGGSDANGVAEGIVQAAGSPGYLGQAQWPIFELGYMNLNMNNGGQNRNYAGTPPMTDLFASPGYQGTEEVGLRFRASQAESMQSFEVLAISSDGSANTLTFTLRTDSTVGQNGGSHPSPLAQAGALASATVTMAQISKNLTEMDTPTGQGTFVKVGLPSPLSAGSYYWVVISSSEASTGVILARLTNPYRALVLNSQNDYATQWGPPADGPSELSFRVTTSGESIINTITGSPKYNYFSGLAQSLILTGASQIRGAWVEAEPNGEIMTVSIQTDSGSDSPSGTVIASGGTQLTVNPFPFVAFTSTASLNLGTKYWLVMTIGPCLSSSCSSPAYAYGLEYRQDYDNSPADYGGSALHYEVLSGSSWVTPGQLGDLNFILAG